jgi:hypothetical protein
LQGLLLRPDLAWEVLFKALERRPMASLRQLGAWLAVCRSDAGGLARICGGEGESAIARLQPAEILRWLPPPAREWLLSQAAQRAVAAPFLIALQAHAMAECGGVSAWLASLPLDACLSSPHGEWLDLQLARALVRSGELPSPEQVQLFQGFAALRMATLASLIRHQVATPAARERAWAASSTDPMGIELLTAVASTEPRDACLSHIQNQFARLRRADGLWCSAAAGWVALVPAIVGHARRDKDSELARLCLFALMGMQEELRDEPDPHPDNTMFAQAMTFARSADADLRLLDGRPRSDAVIRLVTRRGFQFQRRLAWRISPPPLRTQLTDPLRPAFPH